MYQFRLIFIFLIALTGIEKLSAQPYVDLVNLRYLYFPKQYLLSDDHKQISSQFDASVLVPFVQRNKSVFVVSGFYRVLNSITSSEKFTLHSTGMQISYDYQWKDSLWRTQACFIPKINADELGFTNDRLQLGGVVFLKYRLQPPLQLLAGLYYNTELFGNYFVPLAGLNWKANDRLNIFGYLPSIMNIEYRLNKKLYTGFIYTSSVSTYMIDDRQQYIREGDEKVGQTHLKLYFNYYLKNSFVILAESGFTYKRIYNIYDTNKNLIESENDNIKIDDGIFFVVGLAYRIRIDK